MKEHFRAATRRPRVCLIALNSAWYQSNLALYYLRNSLRGLPFSTRILEFTTSEPVTDVLKGIVLQKPDLLCFSAYIWNRDYLQHLLPELKKLLPRARMVLGGPEAGAGVFGLGADDYVVEGPGEGAFRKLAESGFDLPGGVYSEPAPPLQDIPFPYLAKDKPALRDKLVYYESSRGCPFHCVYCLSASDERNERRFDVSLPREVKKLYSELDRLVALQPRTIKFVDRSFNIHPRLAREIWQHAISYGSACEFHFEIYPDLLCEEDIRLLESAPAGRIRFETGIQTVNSAVSANCQRKSDWNKAKPMLQALRERTQVCLHADLLAGLPGETYRSLLHSLDELAECFPHEIQLGLLKILPHTPMQDIARQRAYSWMDQPPYQILSSDKLSFDQVARLYDLSRIINLYWNKQEFPSLWKGLLHSGHRASQLFLRLLGYHYRHGLQLHSISRQHRAEVVSACFPDTA